MGRLTAEQKVIEILQPSFPVDSLPVLYPSFWSDNLSEEYKIENNTNGVILDPIREVYKTYYNLLLDTSTISAITYDNTRTPYPLIFIIRYKAGDKELYLWEYYTNWMNIKNLNTTKWI